MKDIELSEIGKTIEQIASKLRTTMISDIPECSHELTMLCVRIGELAVNEERRRIDRLQQLFYQLPEDRDADETMEMVEWVAAKLGLKPPYNKEDPT